MDRRDLTVERYCVAERAGRLLAWTQSSACSCKPDLLQFSLKRVLLWLSNNQISD